jgi:hypothetical protein
MLGEAYVLNGEIDKAADVAMTALNVSTESQFLIGVGLSRQVMGRIARARGVRTEAKRHLEEAAALFSSVGARFELARTHLELASIGGRRRRSVTSRRRARCSAP